MPSFHEMPEINLHISPYLAAPLQKILQASSNDLRQQLAIHLRGPEDADPDLVKAWRDGLLDSLQADISRFNALLGHILGTKPALHVDEATAVHLMRATAALRLRLKEAFLQNISDEALETGSIEFHHFDPETQQQYAAYLVLAALQEQLIEQIDPEAGEAALPDG